MLEKDATYTKMKGEKMLDRHPSLVDSYRTILFDWLSEVSHECKFHRETYHLALDYIDRYLYNQSNVGKYQLQLIGVTCLFLAAKYEEIRPPTVNEFADLTDGACKPNDIIDNEAAVLSAINWDITPMTPNNWLNIYMQILVNLDDNEEDVQAVTSTSKSTTTTAASKSGFSPVFDENSGTNDSRLTSTSVNSTTTKTTTRNDSFILPTNNGILRYNHKRIASVVDLALLHIQSLRFSNSILTASALFHFTSEQTVRQCTGYKYQDLSDCIHWLEPFVEAIREIEDPVFIASCKDDTHATQMHTHIATAGLLDIVNAKIESKRQSLKRKACTLDEDGHSDESEVESLFTTSPLKPTTTVLLTPPSSTRKSRRIR